MYYSQPKVIMGGLAHIPVLILIVNLIKGKFATIIEKAKVVEIKEEIIKADELKKSEVKEEPEQT